MPEKIFRTELAFLGVLCVTRFRVFHRSSYKNRKSSAWSAYHTGQIPEQGSSTNTEVSHRFPPDFRTYSAKITRISAATSRIFAHQAHIF